MKKIKWKHSLRNRIILMMAGALFLICSVIIGYNLYIYRIMTRQMTQTISNILGLYTEEVEFSLDNTESFLINRCLVQNTIRKIRNPRKQLDRYLAVGEIQELFESSIDSYNLMDGLFLYDKKDSIYIGESKLEGVFDYTRLFNGSMSRLIQKFEASASEMENEWFSFQTRDEYFLVKMFEIQDVYVGSWIHTDTVLKKLQKISTDEEDYVLMLDAEHTVLRQGFPLETVNTFEKTVAMENTDYRIIHSGTTCSAFSFLILQNQKNFLRNVSGIGFQAGAAGIVILFLCFTMALIQKRFFGKPIDRLVNAMNQLKNGNLDVRIQEENVFDEFRIVNDTFDSMIKDIEKLKIDVYEEKLNKQHAELMYLQEQINPHFLTNCMNLIRNLSIIGENDKVQEAAVLVSNHMRYSLARSTQVTLQKELQHVANYEKLQKMRYGDKFVLSVYKEDNLENCEVPTMLIQVFVENAIKHQLDPEKQLFIEIRIWHEYERWLHIHIQDSGEGFEENILQHLNAHEQLINSKGEHVGIYNVCQRLEILYGQKASILFSNGTTCGAQIDIRIPFHI